MHWMHQPVVIGRYDSFQREELLSTAIKMAVHDGMRYLMVGPTLVHGCFAGEFADAVRRSEQQDIDPRWLSWGLRALELQF